MVGGGFFVFRSISGPRFLYFVRFFFVKKKDGSFPDGLRLHDN